MTSPISTIRPGAAAPAPAIVARTAQAFEAQTLGALLQPIFATAEAATSSFGGGSAEAAWRPMLVDAIATRMAAAGGIGLAASVQAEMLRMQAANQGTTPTTEGTPP
ncbi:rod-binding protein [Humitalea sp. 24SJ18S-53]|uniref:rod-binding protein n=1 Tax=Humitalea sp. 24SJ18S-53 TaxID=3422307 RepID=UPI003D670DCD